MRQALLLILGAFLLAACDNEPAADIDQAVSSASPKAADDSMPMSGHKAYLEVCAGCHETGAEGAPVVGDPEYWKDRSHLWQAVLMNHANAGYFDMPAKGGRPTLPDRTIDSATEYMMSITYPDLQPDQ